jgi:leader peptidase (prepilin peptidase) / N-methyltransferase
MDGSIGASLASASWATSPLVVGEVSYDTLRAILEINKVLWAFAFGACIGSLINVLVYRIPRGLDFVSPSSRCPSCDTKLTWRENIPIFGWLALRGRCRFCRSKISPEYPLVEFFVAMLWVVTCMVCYADPTTWLGGVLTSMQPDWARSGFVQTWPIFGVVLTLFSCLVAMTLVDAKTFTIPPVLTNVPTAVGAIVHVGWAVALSAQGRTRLDVAAPGQGWSIWTPGGSAITEWMLVGASIGGTLGLVVANVLLAKGWIARSFADYAQWEAEHEAKQEADRESDALGETPARGESTETAAADASPTDNWIAYPHARREMARELLFIGFPIALALVGAVVASKLAGPGILNPNTLLMESKGDIPLWLRVLSGVFLGYLIGGGVVWVMRILGTLAFGKEALGLGDVHMMAAVGVCVGWIDPVLAFFGAAFLGMGWFGISLVLRGAGKKVMPFGPFLAMGTVLVFFAKPLLEMGASWAMKAIPPINFP